MPASETSETWTPVFANFTRMSEVRDDGGDEDDFEK